MMNLSIAIISIFCFHGSAMHQHEENQGILQENRSHRREEIQAQYITRTTAEDAIGPKNPLIRIPMPNHKQFQNLTGTRFGRLVVTGFAGVKGKNKHWDCACDCGETTVVFGGHLKDGHTQSCGCSYLDARTPMESIPEPSPGTRHIPLTGGKYAIIDECDYELVSGHFWYFDGRGYASRSTSKANGSIRREIKLHRALLNAGDGFEVDHRNGDPMDNRRLNLRLATSSQNKCNQKRSIANTSGFKGVSRNRHGKWIAQIKFQRKHHFLGVFKTPKDAHDAYCEASARLHGEFGRTS